MTIRYQRDDWISYHELKDGSLVLEIGEVKHISHDDSLLVVDNWDTRELTIKRPAEVRPARVRVLERLIDPESGEVVAEAGEVYDPHCTRWLRVLYYARLIAAEEEWPVTYAWLVAAGNYKPGDIVKPPSCDAARATVIRDITPAGEETPHYLVRLDNKDQTVVEYSEDQLAPVGWRYR